MSGWARPDDSGGIAASASGVFQDRTLFYVSHLLRRQGQAGVDWDYQLLPVYAIAIPNHRLEKKGPVIRRVTLQDQNQEAFYDKLGLVFIELPRFGKTEEQLRRIWIAGYTFSNMPGVGDHADGI
ncbi:MAG: PD-(D/E)XK nuclease family transposase [Candidatus Competibacteraceae bacterium]|nr:PD-(D/E)XK nuclease family transposase [Candidatus Competibacteraceae bacterium]